MTDSWILRLQDLLAGQTAAAGAGAQLVVIDPDGTEVFRTPLARHFRVDEDDPRLIWVRPIIGGYAPADPASTVDYAFSLNAARRRGLGYTDARLEGDDIVLDLRTGQTARIQAAEDAERAELWRWDDFTTTVLTPDEAAALTELRDDSWHGRFA
jgi:hypothetical protein